MKVLFVSSGNSRFGIIPFIKSQGESLIKNGIDVEFFSIKGKGYLGYLNNLPTLRRHIKKKSLRYHTRTLFPDSFCCVNFSLWFKSPYNSFINGE